MDEADTHGTETTRRETEERHLRFLNPSGSTKPIIDEAANEEHVPTHSNDPLLSDKDRLQLKELAKKLERRNKLSTPGLKRLRKVGRTARIESSEDEEVTLVDEAQGRNDDNLMFDTGVFDEQEVEVENSEKEAQKSGKRLKRVAGSYATQKSPKKPKVMKYAKDVTKEEAAEYEKEKEELRLSLKIISNDDSEVNYEPLSRKFPIVNWKYQLLGNMEEKDMLVQERFQDHPLKGHDLLLWGVHTLFMDGKPMEINMLVEKKYPLVKELLEKMLNLQLEAEEESTMAFELIKFIKSLLEE
ncbi:hypothetical protein Tco_0212910 [Tanacetum coccineum]